jgi:hypothetical protein
MWKKLVMTATMATLLLFSFGQRIYASDDLWTTEETTSSTVSVYNNDYTVNWHPVVYAQNDSIDLKNSEVRDELIREAGFIVNGQAVAGWTDSPLTVQGTRYDGYLTFKTDRSASNNALARVYISFNSFYYQQAMLVIVDSASGSAVDSSAWSMYALSLRMEVKAERPDDSYEDSGTDEGIVKLPASVDGGTESEVEVPDTGEAGPEASDPAVQVPDTGYATDNPGEAASEVPDTGYIDRSPGSATTEVPDTGAAENNPTGGDHELPDVGSIGDQPSGNVVEVPDTGYINATPGPSPVEVPDTGYIDAPKLTSVDDRDDFSVTDGVIMASYTNPVDNQITPGVESFTSVVLPTKLTNEVADFHPVKALDTVSGSQTASMDLKLGYYSNNKWVILTLATVLGAFTGTFLRVAGTKTKKR